MLRTFTSALKHFFSQLATITLQISIEKNGRFRRLIVGIEELKHGTKEILVLT